MILASAKGEKGAKKEKKIKPVAHAVKNGRKVCIKKHVATKIQPELT
jgi:hypothetical protein